MDVDANGAGKVTDYQFVQALETCGRALLVKSMKPAAIAVRKEAATAVIDYFAEHHNFTYTANQIFKRIHNLRERLKRKFNTQKMGEADTLLMQLLTEENGSIRYSFSVGDGDTDQITKLQFVKTLSECGRAFLNNSEKPAAKKLKWDAAKSMKNTFHEDFDIKCTERQIFNKFKSMKMLLEQKIRRKSPLTKAETMLMKLLDEETIKKEQKPTSTSSGLSQSASNSYPTSDGDDCSSPLMNEGILGESILGDDVFNELEPLVAEELNTLNGHEHDIFAPINGCSTSDDTHDALGELRQRVLTKQLDVFQKQVEVLDIQKEVCLLKKELLLVKLKAQKSNEESCGC